MQETNKPLYAGFFVRLSAAFIDGIIVFMLLLLVRVPVWITTLSMGNNPFSKAVLFRFSAWDIAIYLLGTMYYVLMIYYVGATIGKKLLHIKVIGEDATLSFLTVLYRETVGKYISSAILCVGFFMIGIESQKRGLHDILCDTWVIYDFDEKKKEKSLDETYLKETNPKLHEFETTTKEYEKAQNDDFEFKN
ncbi:MAG: RDD family protein [Velocimicrobium sp.]